MYFLKTRLIVSIFN